MRVAEGARTSGSWDTRSVGKWQLCGVRDQEIKSSIEARGNCGVDEGNQSHSQFTLKLPPTNISTQHSPLLEGC